MPSPYIYVNGMTFVRDIGIRGPRSFVIRSLGPYISVTPSDEAGDYDHQPDDQFNTAIDQSFLHSAVAFRMVPAAKSAVEALEMVQYEGITNGDGDHEACVICMEEVMVGSHLTRMPCSHLFHGDCIRQWLRRNHTCPLCRFKLPIN